MTNKLHPFDRSIITSSYISETVSPMNISHDKMNTYEDAIPIHDSQLFDLEDEIPNPSIHYVYYDRLNSELVSHSYLWETPNYPEVRMVLKSTQNDK